MNNYSNNKPHYPHGFKEEVKIKYHAVKVVARKFPSGTAVMMPLLGVVVLAIGWAGYCALTPAKQLVREERGDELNKAMLYLKNSKSKNAKEDLRLAYSQGNITVYLPIIKGMTKYLLKQYPNNLINAMIKRGVTIREMIQNPKTRIVTRVTVQVHTLNILQHQKNSLLLAEELV